MGNEIFKKSSTNENYDLDDKIRSLNRICSSQIFFNKTGNSIQFIIIEKDESSLFEKPPLVKAFIYDCLLYNNGFINNNDNQDISGNNQTSITENKRKSNDNDNYPKLRVLNYVDFLEFYAVTLKSLPIFMDKLSTSHHNNISTEDEICFICEKNTSNILLECMHQFCSNCIETWLFKKKNDCPLCRKNIDLKTYDKDTWDIIEFSNENRIDYISQITNEFFTFYNKIFVNKK
jgi:hypothetical protein